MTTEPESGSPATCYHETVTDLRRTLVTSAVMWERANSPFAARVFEYRAARRAQAPCEPPGPAVSQAYAATLMAWGYAYTLAAVLGVAEREFGPEVARRLAFGVDEILINGDFDDLNADVMPAPDTVVPPAGDDPFLPDGKQAGD